MLLKNVVFEEDLQFLHIDEYSVETTAIFSGN